MKKTVIIIFSALFVLATVAIMAFSNPEPQKQKIDITGTWQLDKYRYGNAAGEFTSVIPNQPHIKLITEKRFLWATYDTATKKIVESAGGAYTLEGSNYSETIDFGYGMDTYLGTVSKFHVNVADGMMFLTGYLGTGYKIEEVWRKVE